MIYDQNDNHSVVNAIKNKGWHTFHVHSSRIKNQWSEWLIDTPGVRISHKPIDGKYLGGTIKEALFTIGQDTFPTLKLTT